MVLNANSTNSTCVCDQANGYVINGTGCVQCSSIANSTATATNTTDCQCSTGYTWSTSSLSCSSSCNGTGQIYNSTLGACSCDTTNGYFASGTVCVKCSAVASTVGASYDLSTCLCKTGYDWSNSTSACVCASNSKASECTQSSSMAAVLGAVIPVTVLAVIGLAVFIAKVGLVANTTGAIAEAEGLGEQAVMVSHGHMMDPTSKNFLPHAE